MNRQFAYLASFTIAVATATSIVLPAQGQVRSDRGTPSRQQSRPAIREKVADDLEKEYEEFSQQLAQDVPKRTYKVQTGQAEKTKLFRADPKLLENKFFAEFVILTKMAKEERDELPTFPSNGIRDTDRDMNVLPKGFGNTAYRYPESIKRLLGWDQATFHFPMISSSRVKAISLSERNMLLLEHCSANEKPTRDVTEFLISTDCDRDVHCIPFSTSSTEGWHFTIYGPTAEQAEQRARGQLQLIDAGLCRTVQRYLFEEGQKSLEEAKKQFAIVAQENAALRAEEEKIAQPSEISTDILSQLKAQKVMIAIELSGLSARVRACDEMLKEPKKLEVSTLQSISDMKVKAEIERVGIKEKLDQINTLIGEGDNRQATRERVLSMRNTLFSRSQPIAAESEQKARTMAQLFELYAPPPLKDDQITISPVEWTN